MAPEVISCKGYTFAADWWSFGILMFEMLTGRIAFEGKNKKETQHLIVKAPLKVPSYILPRARLLMKGLLQKNPNYRLGSGKNLFIKNERYCTTI